MTPGRIPLAGVIGDPIAHSRSPRLHGHWLARYGLPGHYVPLHVAAADLAAVLAAMPRMGFVGANVTLPHKVAALALATRATDRAARIGAANTLTFLPEGGFEADNTDGEGFLRNLRQGAPGWNPAAGPALVLGAGGAARAVLAALIDAGVPEIRLANRTAAATADLAAAFGPVIRPCAWEDRAAALAGAATLVNATSLGLAGTPALEMPLDALAPGALVTDLVYTPLETPLLADARTRGAAVVDGLGMLLHQAAPGFERWFGRAPEVDEALRRVALAP
ncbi:MAG: shikimate dehydrogenase [Gemmobacter sp.]